MLNLPLIGLFSYIEKFRIICTFIFSYWSVRAGDRGREQIANLGYRIKQRYILAGTVEKFKSFDNMAMDNGVLPYHEKDMS